MLRNYLKIATRLIVKHKSFSLINILGLAIGIACSVMILAYVIFELGYDRYHKNADNIYRLAVRANIGDTKIHQTYSSAATFLKILEDFPEVVRGVKFLNFDEVPVILDDKTYYQDRFFGVDSTFFQVFTVPLIHGDPVNCLVEPNSMVLSESTAMKYFGGTDVLGKVLRVVFPYGLGNLDFTIRGVSEDMPAQSHFHFNVLISNTTFPSLINNTGWTSNNFITYLQLEKGTSPEEFDEKLKEFTRENMGGESFDEWVEKGNSWEYFLQPIREIHLGSDLNGEFEPNGNRTYTYIFSVIGLIILLIACINFMNLTTAKSSLRTREVGLRKVAGSSRQRLIRQFLFESVLLSMIALFIGIVLVELLLPAYRNFVNRPISLDYFGNPYTIPALLLLGLVVGLVSGSYPAFYLSSLRPAAVIKGETLKGKGNSWLRSILVVGQFFISIFLIISTLVVAKQLHYFQTKDLGFVKEQVLVIHNPGSLGDQAEVLKKELMDVPGILAVSASNALPGTSFSNIGFGAEGIEQSFTLNLCICDYDFLDALKIRLIKGRFFSRDFKSDSAAAVLNKKAVELLGFDDPIGKKINNWATNRGNFHVIGVVDDYHYESLHSEIRPMVLFLNHGYYDRNEDYISIRFETADVKKIIRETENIWKKLVPGSPFKYSFLDDDYTRLYENETRTETLFTIFSFLAIFIACLGLYGLAAFVAEQKIKEIGIRKVLGATVGSLVLNLNRRFVTWVLLANILAWPLAWWVMHRWLREFAYRINIPVWVFFLAAFLALFIAITITTTQTLRAAWRNPADSLRYE